MGLKRLNAEAYVRRRMGILLPEGLEQALAYVKEKQIPMLHTGDLIDSLADETFAYIDKKLQDVDYIYAAGNHDYLPLGG